MPGEIIPLTIQYFKSPEKIIRSVYIIATKRVTFCLKRKIDVNVTLYNDMDELACNSKAVDLHNEVNQTGPPVRV